MFTNKFSSIPSIIKDAKKGKMFILVDDKDREKIILLFQDQSAIIKV